ncbi:MAG: FeS assembly protein SufB, partial [Candidatus Roizmanbacteria bacterium GW2011_GWA2_35_8]
SVFRVKKGINEEIVSQISKIKKEPLWMKEFRLKSYLFFKKSKMPEWGADLSKIDFENIFYYIRATDKAMNSWEDLPSEIKETYDRIGVPEAEKNFLAGVSAQYESEVVYESIQKELTKQGVIFCDMDTGLRKYSEIVKKYFGTIISPYDNKFASLNSSVWSGGSFVYVPRGVKVALPLQAYFRINARNFGQFERTLIIAEPDSFVHYIEGCSAPAFSSASLHAAVVEIIVKKGARVQYTTVQNWFKNIYNLVTKRAWVEEDGTLEVPSIRMLAPR